MCRPKLLHFDVKENRFEPNGDAEVAFPAQNAAVQAGGLWRQPPLDSIDSLIASSAGRELLVGHNRVTTTDCEASRPIPQDYGLMGSLAKSADPRGRSVKAIFSIF